MSARYAPLPNPPSFPDAERELDDAFGADHDDEDVDANETTPFTSNHQPPPPPPPTQTRINVYGNGSGNGSGSSGSTPVPGAYDFEREYEYDYPPPGSPSRPSSLALPNNIGNSNGLLPTSPIRVQMPRMSLFRRAVGAILPTHYARVPSESSHGRGVVGGGLENDGVFANVTAKPSRAREVSTEDGGAYLVPEDAQKDVPPSYAAAQLDAVPPYWETTIHAPSRLVGGADMIVDDLPSGSIWVFALNLIISYFFQLVGFLLTYLLHTSHAAKYGSRAGLGLTLIQFGFYTRSSNSNTDGSATPDVIPPPPPFMEDGKPLDPSAPMPSEPMPAVGGMSSKEWMAFILMTIGWFILLSSAAGFWRVKHWESSIRSTNPPPATVEEIERDIAIRRNLEVAFGVSFGSERDQRNHSQSHALAPDEESPEAARLRRELTEAGFI